MEVSEFQKLASDVISLLDDRSGIERTDTVAVAHLVEELGELVHEVNLRGFKNKAVDPVKLSYEFADVFLMLAALATSFDVDLEKAVLEKIEILKIRTAPKTEK